MSDYLWDKTGEADEETRRLEEMLGRFGFEPRPLELPETLPVRAPVGRAHGRRFFAGPRLALAASLAAALLVGAWLVLGGRQSATHDAPRLAGQHGQPGDDKGSPAAVKGAGGAKDAAEADGANGATKAGEVDNAGESKGARPALVPERRENLTAAPRKPRLPDLAKAERRGPPRVGRAPSLARTKRPAHPAPRPAAAARQEVASTQAEREAAEKVLYALRITSEKLNYARQQVQESARGDNR